MDDASIHADTMGDTTGDTMIRTLRNRMQEETVFVVSLALAITTSFFVRPTLASIDWHVLGSLFNLMAAVLGLERARLFDRMALRLVARFCDERTIALAMVWLTGLLSTVVTNDVALISLVPLTLIIAKKSGIDPLWMVILQTLAANIGSALTPMGNPQNLYLFSFHHLSPLQLMSAALPFTLLGMGLLTGLVFLLVPSRPLTFSIVMERIQGKGRLPVYLILFAAGVAGVFRLLPVGIVAAVALLVLFVLDRPLLRKLDGFLLLTFGCFFLAIGNLTHMPALTRLAGEWLSTSRGTYAAGLLLSQVISNVPAALLLAPFTPHWHAVFLGVNIGGMGTLIASMASLISYRLYARHHNGHAYLTRFHALNFILLVFFGLGFLLLLP